MAKGRKRKNKRREANGRVQRLSRPHQRELSVLPARSQPHRRNLEDPLDPRAADVLGQLRIAKRITEDEYQAGKAYRAANAAMRRAIDCPRSSPKSGGFDYVPERVDAASVPDSRDVRSEEDEARIARAKWAKMLAAVSNAGVAAADEVHRVCIWDLAPLRVETLGKGLAAAAKHIGIGPVEKSGAGILRHHEAA